MDWIDRTSLAAIGILTVILAGMLVRHHIYASLVPATDPSQKLEAFYERQRQLDENIFKKPLSLEKKGQYTRAVALFKRIIKAHPDRASGYKYLADLYLKTGDLSKSIHYFRMAVEKNPDYVDKKTPLYIGSGLKTLVSEGREKLSREKALKPDDPVVRQALRDIYYLQSRLAGGCE